MARCASRPCPTGAAIGFRRLVVDIDPLRRDRDFRLLWIGQVVSGLGRQVTAIVLPYQLYVL